MSDDRVTMSDIARHIGVTLQAVSNWRRRHSLFPLAVPDAGKEWFGRAAVADWLDGRKVPKTDLRPGELPGVTYGARFRTAMSIQHQSDPVLDEDLWRAAVQFRGTEDIAVFADLVLGLVYLAVSNDRAWTDLRMADAPRRKSILTRAAEADRPHLEELTRAFDRFTMTPFDSDPLPGIFELVDRIRQSQHRAGIFEFLLDRFATGEGRRVATMHTPAAIVRLVVELVDPRPGTSILDPCCGSGGFLVGAAQHLLKQGGSVEATSFTGHALSAREASLAHMNVVLHGMWASDVDAGAERIFRGDRQSGENERFGTVLTNPPFDMKPHEPKTGSKSSGTGSSLDWLRYAASVLDVDGRAAVVMSGGSLSRTGTDQQIRATLVDNGNVEAVVMLPPGLFAATGIPVSVWLLRRPASSYRREILLIDAASLGYLINRTQRTLSDDDRNRVVDTVVRWRASQEYQPQPGFTASVDVARIRSEGYVLTPGRYVGLSPVPDMPAPSVQRLRDELAWLDRRAAEVDRIAEEQLDRIDTWTR